ELSALGFVVLVLAQPAATIAVSDSEEARSRAHGVEFVEAFFIALTYAPIREPTMRNFCVSTLEKAWGRANVARISGQRAGFAFCELPKCIYLIDGAPHLT